MDTCNTNPVCSNDYLGPNQYVMYEWYGICMQLLCCLRVTVYLGKLIESSVSTID